MTERLGVRVARTRLTELVDRAARGERIVITRRGEAVAQIGPLESPQGDVTLDDLAARGLVVAPRRDDRPEPAVIMPMWAGTRLDQILREVRGR